MPNFNTKEMKVSITRTKGETMATNKRLSAESVNKLEQVLEFSIECEDDALIVVAFIGYYIHDDDFARIKMKIENELEAEIVFSMADFIVFRTEENRVVTLKLNGGASRFSCNVNKKDKKDGDHKKTKRDDDDGNGADGSLTQECSGIFDMTAILNSK